MDSAINNCRRPRLNADLQIRIGPTDDLASSDRFGTASGSGIVERSEIPRLRGLASLKTGRHQAPETKDI